VRGQPAVPTGLGQRLVSHHRNVKLMEASLDIDLGNKISMPEIALAVDAASLATWFPASLLPLLSPPRCQLNVQQAAPRWRCTWCARAACSVAWRRFGTANAAAASVTPLGRMRYVCVATKVFANHWFGDGFIADAVQLAPAVVSDRDMMSGFLQQVLGWRGAYPHHTLPLSARQRMRVRQPGLRPDAAAQVSRRWPTERLVDLLPDRTSMCR
jgi:LysR family transcriptional regulator (chromosome initiation inhibitor)